MTRPRDVHDLAYGDAPDAFDQPDGRTYSEPGPGASRPTPGRAVYEAAQRAFDNGHIGTPTIPYDELGPLDGNAWEDIAQAAMLAAAQALLPDGITLDELAATVTQAIDAGTLPPASASHARRIAEQLRAENEQLRGWLVGIMRGNDAEIEAAREQADHWIVEAGL